MTPEDPSIEDVGARLLAVLQGLDLTSADGRAGIGSLLSEIERLSPGSVLQQEARIELRALGWGNEQRFQTSMAMPAATDTSA